MPSRNTNYARHRGFSSMKALNEGTKDFGIRRGHPINSEEARKKSGKKPAQLPPKGANTWPKELGTLWGKKEES